MIVKCCKVPSTFNLLAISFPHKVVSDRCTLVSIETRPFDKTFIMNCKKVELFPICICTVASVPFDGSDVSAL